MLTLAQQFVWMNLLLERTETIDPPEKNLIKEALKMYDRLWSESPTIKKIRTESKAEGLQSALVTIVKARFPALTELAQQKAANVSNQDILNYLIAQISTETDENVVRGLLRPTVA